MEEARPRFPRGRPDRGQGARRGPASEHDGTYYQIRAPRSAAPDLPSERRFYASAVSPESAEIMAKLGFGMLMIMQNEWPKAAADIHRFRDIAVGVGHPPRPPIVLTNVCVAESRAEATTAR